MSISHRKRNLKEIKDIRNWINAYQESEGNDLTNNKVFITHN